MLNTAMNHYVISSLNDFHFLLILFLKCTLYHGKMTKIRDISKHSVIDIDIRNIDFLIYIHVYIDHWEIHHIRYWPPLRPGWGWNSRPLEGTLLTISGHRADHFVIFARPKSRFWWRTVLSALVAHLMVVWDTHCINIHNL